jgi:hypothetical protein
MSTHIVKSETELQTFIGDVREMFHVKKFLKISVRAGKDRSLDQNALSHCWYGQLARELREDNEVGWKSYCKLHFGVPILRADDEKFREFYDRALKVLHYEQKLAAMQYVPVTSLMTKPQLSAYLEAMQFHFLDQHGVRLEFPKEEA